MNGARAVELVGDQRLSKGRLRTRSLHVYKGKAEYVIEMRRAARATSPRSTETCSGRSGGPSG